MAKVTFRLPSRKIQYGYAEVDINFSDSKTPAEIGEAYIKYVLEFQAAEVAAVEAAREQAKSVEAAPGNPAAAKARLEAGKKPRTVDESSEMIKQLLEAELGATVVSEETEPWDEPAPPKAEPWKNQSTIEDLFA